MLIILVSMVKWIITHDRPNCIACAACAAITDNWTLETEDGLADPVKSEISEEELAENQEAAGAGALRRPRRQDVCRRTRLTAKYKPRKSVIHCEPNCRGAAGVDNPVSAMRRDGEIVSLAETDDRPILESDAGFTLQHHHPLMLLLVIPAALR